ncbi:MAG: large conductance mechanosensitive channel protein MscL, partial [Kaistella sp.]
NISKLAWNGVTYGNFLAAVINFICIALVLFIMIKGINKINKPVEVAPAGPSNEEILLAEIRDLLKTK